MNTAIVYARYSSNNQREESIDAQLRNARTLAEKNSISILKTYIDKALSGKTDDRESFVQMMSDIRHGIMKPTFLITDKVDRFARNKIDSAYHKYNLKKRGIKVIYSSQVFDDTPEGHLMEGIMESFAQYHSENLAGEVMKGLKENAYKCLHTGGLPPLGYDVDEEKRYVVNEYEAAAVKSIFTLYADGASFTQISDWLNARGYKSKEGNTFNRSRLHYILINEKYAGVFTYNKTNRSDGKRTVKKPDEIIKIRNGIPNIVDPELFQEVKKKMEKNRHKGARNKAKHEFLLSGLIRCGNCGHAMVGNTRISGQSRATYSSYECGGKRMFRTCTLKSVSKEKIEEFVIQGLYNKLFSPGRIDKVASMICQYAKDTSNEAMDDTKALQKKLKSVEGDIRNIITAIKKGIYNDTMKDEMDKLETQKKELEYIIAQAADQAKRSLFTEESIKKYLLEYSNIKDMPSDRKRKMVQTFVESVTVFDDKVDVISIVDMSGAGGPYRFKYTISLPFPLHKSRIAQIYHDLEKEKHSLHH